MPLSDKYIPSGAKQKVGWEGTEEVIDRDEGGGKQRAGKREGGRMTAAFG